MMIVAEIAWRWLAVGMMMVVTFLFGTDAFSSENTRPIIRWIMELFFGKGASQFQESAGEGWLRKSAHFLEYALLAFLWWRALAPRPHSTPPGQPSLWRAFVLAWGLTTLWAAVDEAQQAYINRQRTGAVADVVLDSAGAAAALAVAALWSWWSLRK